MNFLKLKIFPTKFFLIGISGLYTTPFVLGNHCHSCFLTLPILKNDKLCAADNCAVSIRDGRLKMHAAEIHNGHECHHQLQSRRAKLTTGNTTSMHMCTILLFELVPQTQKSPSYGPKCPAKNQPSFLFLFFSLPIVN